MHVTLLRQYNDIVCYNFLKVQFVTKVKFTFFESAIKLHHETVFIISTMEKILYCIMRRYSQSASLKYFDELKGKVSRDFRGLQMILMDRTWPPDVPLKV